MYKLITCFLVVLITSCSCAKKTTANATEETNKTMEVAKKMMDDGFTSGTIEYSKKEGDCEYTIKLKDERYFESANMDKKFLKDGTKVWFKYRGLRRMSRCPKANPIEIEEMLIRE